ALTKGCSQIRWGAKYYFPCCPKEKEIISLETYFQNLKIGSVFAYNDDSPKLIAVQFARIKNNSSILVMCEREISSSEKEGFQPWLITEITYNNALFIHAKVGSYFEKDDADKEFY